MRVIITPLVFFALASFISPKPVVPKVICDYKSRGLKIFILKDTSNDKYFVSDSIKVFFRKGYIGKSPLIAIDGVVFNYQKDLDTIILPLTKSDITTLAFLNKKSSPVIYGRNAVNGTIIINTVALQILNDSLRLSREKN